MFESFLFSSLYLVNHIRAGKVMQEYSQYSLEFSIIRLQTLPSLTKLLFTSLFSKCREGIGYNNLKINSLNLHGVPIMLSAIFQNNMVMRQLKIVTRRWCYFRNIGQIFIVLAPAVASPIFCLTNLRVEYRGGILFLAVKLAKVLNMACTVWVCSSLSQRK